jgi:hypothetical protein
VKGALTDEYLLAPVSRYGVPSRAGPVDEELDERRAL